MKRIFKYACALLAGVVAMTVASCTEEYDYDAPSTSEVGGNFFLSAPATSFSYLPTEEQTFSLKVNRVDTTQAETVNLTSSNSNFSVAPVAFEVGEASKTVVVNFNIATGTTETTTIAVDENNAYIYGVSQYNFSVTRFKAYNATLVMGAFEAQIETPVYQVGNGRYMIPVTYVTDENGEIVTDEEGEPYIAGYEDDLIFTINAKNEVTVPTLAHAWWHSSYGWVAVIGNANKDANANGAGSGVAGTYDPEQKTVTMNLYHFVPGLGGFGTFPDYLILEEDL